jgi:hypothetical protein
LTTSDTVDTARGRWIAVDLERWTEANDRLAVLRGLHERAVFDLKR